MEINPDQIQKLSTLLNEGNSLSDIQRFIIKEWNWNITYMELKLLIGDLQLSFPETKEIETKKAEQTPISDVVGVQVEVDPVTAPTALANGTVTFTDGVVCQWQIDRMGRIGLIPKQEGYTPPDEDIQEFQKALHEKLQARAF